MSGDPPGHLPETEGQHLPCDGPLGCRLGPRWKHLAAKTPVVVAWETIQGHFKKVMENGG